MYIGIVPYQNEPSCLVLQNVIPLPSGVVSIASEFVPKAYEYEIHVSSLYRIQQVPMYN